MKKCTLTLLLLSCALLLKAQPGSLDLNFGNAGISTTGFGGEQATAKAMAIQADGKIVLVGHAIINSIPKMAIARYNTNGSPDNSFNGNGTVIFEAAYESEGNAVVLQPDGKIVVAGYARSNGGSKKVCVARFTPDGLRDKSFNLDGFVIDNPAGSANSVLNAVALQDGGYIVAAGRADMSMSQNIIVMRFTETGLRDKGFQDSGIRVYDHDNNRFNESATALLVQPDQKIVVAGNLYSTTSNSSIIMLRMKQDGVADSSFISAGTGVTNLSGDIAATSMTQQPDGKYVLGGSVFNGSGTQFLVLRYKTDGFIDHSFNVNGFVTTPFLANFASVEAVGVQADNKIVAAGYSVFATVIDFAMVRYLSDGTLDDAFGTNGKTTTDILGQDRIHCMKLSGNRIYTGGVINNETFGLAAYKQGDVVLPLTLVNFSGSLSSADVWLNWETRSEQNVSHFEIEYSDDARNFTRLGQVNAGNEPNGHHYSFRHASPAARLLYYRLKMVEQTGHPVYSKTILIRKNETVSIQLFPNPAKDILHLQLNNRRAQTIRCQVTDLSGRVLLSRSFRAGGNAWSTSIDISVLQPGNYFFIVHGEEERVVRKFLKE